MYMRVMSRRRLPGKKSEGKSERPRGKQTAGVSGGHLRLGHFVLSPCSVFSVVRRREEATYALVGSSRLRVALFYKRPSFLVISRVKRNWTRSLYIYVYVNTIFIRCFKILLTSRCISYVVENNNAILYIRVYRK